MTITPLLLYTWVILTKPFTMPVCSLWLDHAPAWADMVTACPQFANYRNALLIWPELLEVRLIDQTTGVTACVQSAYSIPDKWDCQPAQWDQYRIDIVWPNAQYWECTLNLDTQGPPSPELIGATCGPDTLAGYQAGGLILEYRGSYSPAPPAPVCTVPPSPAMGAEIATHEDYQVLAYNLNWYGISDPVNLWQNRFDPEIQAASLLTNVPGQILKRVMGHESQYWPLWNGPAGEVGLIQLTQVGADIALRYSPELFTEYCPQAIYPARCRVGYALLTDWERGHIQAAIMAALTLSGQPLDAARDVSRDVITYARVLAAYYCYTEALLPQDTNTTWPAVLAVYHAGGSCLTGGAVCPAGVSYSLSVLGGDQ